LSAEERAICMTVVSLAVLIAPSAARAQTATIFGSLGNFDAANNAGQDAHGFEIQLEGIQPSDIVVTWPGNKYGSPQIVPYATGVYVRYLSPFDPNARLFTATTVPIAPGTAFAGTCYTWQSAYLLAGCDHFGVHLAYTASADNGMRSGTSVCTPPAPRPAALIRRWDPAWSLVDGSDGSRLWRRRLACGRNAAVRRASSGRTRAKPVTFRRSPLAPERHRGCIPPCGGPH